MLVGSGLTCILYTKLESLGGDKRCSLFGPFVSHKEKKFCESEPWNGFHKNSYDRLTIFLKLGIAEL